ncbi:MAG: lipoyl(octanoyl) transferase [Frankiaceae bacterium]|nr:lipoyl(octanoyl) transferase [Frankiaceae bacterium]
MQIQRLGLVPYSDAWALQRDLAAQRADDQRDDTLLLLEHPSVYTAGRRTAPEERPFDGTPVVDVDRGGKITWHGPGQLVGYPIVRLPQPFDVVAYVRSLEAALIDACAQFGLETRRVDGRSGVWTLDGQRKVAAIGVRVTRGVAMHGFALNCNPDLAAFGAIVPCGIADAGVSSLSAELGKTVTVADALDVVESSVVSTLTRTAMSPPSISGAA